MHSLSVFGTSSDAGKSTMAFVLAKLLQEEGVNVAPFKAQNVSNNAKVTDDGGEIAIPQHFCAEVLQIPSSVFMNPVLLKSGGKGKAHLILNGKSVGERSVWGYYKDIDTLKPIVKEAFLKLQKEYECIVAEGAGSPVELNLMHKDLSNIYVASEFHTKIVLVADIEKGGVFASIYGVYHLLPKELQKNVIGVIVNKFRGDRKLFDNGVEIIEKEFGIPVLGVVPYMSFNMAFEDSASLQNYTQNKPSAHIKVGVIHLPHISNFNDIEPLVLDPELEVHFITSKAEAKMMDLLILPGSKKVIDDLVWLEENSLANYIKKEKKPLVAICGGYEMLFQKLLDPFGVESEKKELKGLSLFKGEVVFQKDKVVKKGCYNLFGVMVDGYEIHNGVTKKRAKHKRAIYGTFVHGLFESDSLRKKIFTNISLTYKGYHFKSFQKNYIQNYIAQMRNYIDITTIKESLYDNS